MEQISNDSGWRGSPEGWLEAAYDLLLESGVDTVRISPLAKKLGLSRTSFYWFFKDREELLAALVTRWRDKNTGNLVKQAEAYAETVAEAMLNVFDCWLDKSLFDSQFEFAVRSWALQSPDILAEVQKADQTRLDAVSQMFVRFGYDEGLSRCSSAHHLPRADRLHLNADQRRSRGPHEAHSRVRGDFYR